jgi:hypothetical protein
VASLLNLTGHPVVVAGVGEGLTIPPMGPPARLSESPVGNGRPLSTEHGCVPLVVVAQGEVTGLPSPEPGVLVIVSRAVAVAAPDREDLVVPHRQQRDSAGRVVNCEALARIEPRC